MAKRKTTTDPYRQIDTLVYGFLAASDPGGESRLRADLRKRYRPTETLENALVETLAQLYWRIHGCCLLEIGMTEDGSPISIPESVSHLLTPKVLSTLDAYKSMLSHYIDNCSQQLDRQAASRRRQNAAAAARLKKLKPCTSVIQ